MNAHHVQSNHSNKAPYIATISQCKAIHESVFDPGFHAMEWSVVHITAGFRPEKSSGFRNTSRTYSLYQLYHEKPGALCQYWTTCIRNSLRTAVKKLWKQVLFSLTLPFDRFPAYFTWITLNNFLFSYKVVRRRESPVVLGARIFHHSWAAVSMLKE